MFKKIFKKRKKETTPSYKAYLSEDTSKYKPNEYVVFNEDGVYAHGDDVNEILKKFEKDFPEQTPFVYKVPPQKICFVKMFFSFLKDYVCDAPGVVYKYEKRYNLYYPSIPIKYKSTTGLEIEIKALVDSGADITLVPKSLGLNMGLKKQDLHYIGGVGGRMGYYLNNCYIAINGNYIKIPVAFATKDNIPFLLGRKGVFNRFEFCFNEKRKKLTVM